MFALQSFCSNQYCYVMGCDAAVNCTCHTNWSLIGIFPYLLCKTFIIQTTWLKDNTGLVMKPLKLSLMASLKHP